MPTTQHLGLAGPEHCPIWELLGVGGGHGFRGVISGSSDEFFGYYMPEK